MLGTITAAAFFAELGLGKAVTSLALKEGVDKLKKASSSKSPFRDRLYSVVQRLLDEYRQKYPEVTQAAKFPFWQSQWALKWALSHRFYAENRELLIADIPADLLQHMAQPTQQELDEFSARVKSFIEADSKLLTLYATENLAAEQFRANSQAEQQRDTTNDLLTTIVHAVTTKPDESDDIARATRVLNTFSAASLSLMGADHDIPNAGIHLDRAETARLILWTQTALQSQETPLAVLEGGAGLGKTVIMQDVLAGLQAQGVIVLALKADRLAAPTYAQLAQRILHGAGTNDFAEALAWARQPDNKQVVVLIDQLDALSQSLSANREALGSYRELIQFLLRQPDVRVLISCRTFDLETDPLLQTYKGKTRFEVARLTPEQIDTVVAASAFAGQTLTPTLRALLAIPLHLRIFCQLEATTDLTGLITLQALYDQLYEQKVMRPTPPTGEVSAPDPVKLRSLLTEIAEAMYKSQRLAVPLTRYTRLYKNEVDYALSQNLLVAVPGGKQIQFFHQSFFDYLFAREFVESGQQLADLIAEGHQGLFIRSAVNQVLQYLRPFDDRAYLQNVQELLLHPDQYRLHIRLLVVQQFGAIADPNASEQQFAKRHLLSSPDMADIFYESVRSAGWASWLIKQDVVLKLIQRPTELTRSEQNFLWYLARQQPALAIEVLTHATPDEHSGPRVSWMLSQAAETTEPGFDTVFARFASAAEAADSWQYWHTLEERATIDPKATAERLFEALKEETWLRYGEGKRRRNIDEWQAQQVAEKLLQAHPAVGFGVLKRLLEYWIEERRVDRLRDAGYDVEVGSIISDSEFAMHTPGDGNAYSLTAKLYDLTQQHLEETARLDPAQARLLLDDWPRSAMRSLLQLTCATYLANPTAFIPDIFELLSRPALLEDVHGGGHLNYYLRELLTHSYPHFTSEQQALLHGCILRTEYKLDWDRRHEPVERDAKHVCRHMYSRNGRLTYGYLAAIPGVATHHNADVKRRYQELNRRFGIVENKAPQGMRTRIGDPSPFTHEQVKLLQPTDWLGAFREHQRPKGEFPFDSYAPGLARHFGEVVKADPLRMLVVLDMLLNPDNQDIPARHLREGLAGLADSPGMNLTQYTGLILRGIANNQISLDDTEGLRLLEKCVRDGRADDRVVELLAQVAVAHRHDQHAVTGDSVDELMDGINTTGGHAIGGLLHCWQMVEHTDLIMDTLRQIGHDGSGAVRAAALRVLSLLTHLLEPATQPIVDVFLALVGTNYRLLKFTSDTLRPLLRPHLAELEPLFTAALAEPVCQEQVAHSLTLAWAWNIPGAYELLQTYWQHSSPARVSSLRLLMHEYSQLSASQKLLAQQMFQELLAYNDKELEDAYEICFHWLTAADFPIWLPLIQAYIAAPVGMGRSRTFYDFLQLCVQDYPAECIELAAAFDGHAAPEMQRNALDKKPLELLLSAYHVLTEIDAGAPQLELAMETFDRMLQQPAYRSGAAEALALVDRG
ncbi:NACHT domain-containing protein [Hymenobacter arizonensis]|uniref:NACHT domain-containing protein n=1 Tax=Hymenobacter arizonensis TaxID=1227077 RepID=A0A1I6BMM5_HYMAR|nr:NACHT domain-containing protein [Hymenobacter arizonensis]SFQ82161.1 NACHT domain-containing protein [Hymenobacter arizonensis]